jgi:hypothetical protein
MSESEMVWATPEDFDSQRAGVTSEILQSSTNEIGKAHLRHLHGGPHTTAVAELLSLGNHVLAEGMGMADPTLGNVQHVLSCAENELHEAIGIARGSMDYVIRAQRMFKSVLSTTSSADALTGLCDQAVSALEAAMQYMVQTQFMSGSARENIRTLGS